MNVKQLIEWLKTQDQDALVQVVYHETDGGHGFYGGDVITQTAFTPELAEYTDFRNNGFIKASSSVYGKTVLLLGSIHN